MGNSNSLISQLLDYSQLFAPEHAYLIPKFQRNYSWDSDNVEEFWVDLRLNYESWKNGIPSIPRILIRYEDLIRNCNNIFENVIKFLSKHMNCKLNSRKIETSIELSKFENLKKYESKNTFNENVGFDNFFRVGKSKNWKKELSLNEAKIIEDKFNSEMIDLGYLT